MKALLTGIVAMLLLAACPAFGQLSISVNIAPPPLQVESQPPCPDDGYIWVPGYWNYENGGYAWVPGQWAQPPQAGWYWTPAYWEWDGNDYVFNPGYWGPTVGYYGGIDYGYGYGGHGYNGGRWVGGYFSYNTAANNVGSAHVHSTYVDPSATKTPTARVSYNGGQGGVQAKPTSEEKKESNEHRPPTASIKPQPSEQQSQAVQPEHPQGQPQVEEQSQAVKPEHPQGQPQVEQPEHQQTEHPQAQAQPESHPSQPAKPNTAQKSAAPSDKKTGN